MKSPMSYFSFPIRPAAGRRGRGLRGGVNRESKFVISPAFTLVEILIVVGLLSVIILGLLAMFGQTQRAFRLGMTQTDVLESGRMATDLIGRELEQMTPVDAPGMGRLADNTPYPQPNFFMGMPTYAPLVQDLPGLDAAGNRQYRTNLLNDVFFLTRRNREWVGIGYFVRIPDPANPNNLLWPLLTDGGITYLGAGTLYRFETNAPALSGRTPADLYRDFYDAAYNSRWSASKIMDGVVHFRLRAYNTNGNWIVSDQGAWGVSYSGSQTNATVLLSSVVPGEVEQYAFYSNAVPVAVDLELGILEDRAWERYKSLYPDTAGQHRYLVNQAGRVHLFRQRIPIRSVDPQAYR